MKYIKNSTLIALLIYLGSKCFWGGKLQKRVNGLMREDENELIDFSIMANGKIAAGTFYFDFLPGGENDFIKYCDGVDGKSTVLNDIDVPVSIIFGSEDVCVLTEPVDIVKAYLKNNISNAQIHVIEGVGHSYAGKYEDLGEIIEKNVLFY